VIPQLPQPNRSGVFSSVSFLVDNGVQFSVELMPDLPLSRKPFGLFPGRWVRRPLSVRRFHFSTFFAGPKIGISTPPFSRWTVQPSKLDVTSPAAALVSPLEGQEYTHSLHFAVFPLALVLGPHNALDDRLRLFFLSVPGLHTIAALTGPMPLAARPFPRPPPPSAFGLPRHGQRPLSCALPAKYSLRFSNTNSVILNPPPRPLFPPGRS